MLKRREQNDQGHGPFQRGAWAWIADWPVPLDLADRGSPGTQRGRVGYGLWLHGGARLRAPLLYGLQRCDGNRSAMPLQPGNRIIVFPLFFFLTGHGIRYYSYSISGVSRRACSILLYLCLRCFVQKDFTSPSLSLALRLLFIEQDICLNKTHSHGSHSGKSAHWRQTYCDSVR